jgi:hypothetical protein
MVNCAREIKPVPPRVDRSAPAISRRKLDHPAHRRDHRLLSSDSQWSPLRAGVPHYHHHRAEGPSPVVHLMG